MDTIQLGKTVSFILTNLCITAYLCIVLISDFEMGTKRETWHLIWISQSKWIHVLWCYCCADAISFYLCVACTPLTIFTMIPIPKHDAGDRKKVNEAQVDFVQQHFLIFNCVMVMMLLLLRLLYIGSASRIYVSHGFHKFVYHHTSWASLVSFGFHCFDASLFIILSLLCLTFHVDFAAQTRTKQTMPA